MNKIYKLVWSQVKNTWVAASEMAKSHGKSGQARGRVTLAATVLGVLMATATPALGVYAADLTADQKAVYDAVLAKLEADKAAVHYFSVNSDNLKGTDDKLFDDFTNYSNKLATGTQSMAIGRMARTPVTGAMAVGHHAVAEGFFSVAIGPDAYVPGEKITSDEYKQLSDEDKQLYRPVDTAATSYLKIKMKSTKDGQDSFEEEVNQGVAVGRHARVQQKRGTAIGSYAETYDLQGTALGFEAHATAENATALGATAKARAKNAVAIGFGTEAAFNDSVALGSFSRAQTKAGISGWDPLNKAISGDKTHVWTSTLPAISVGNDQKGLTRQIINVAAGYEDTDAVNVAQLKHLREKHDADRDELSTRISANNGDISKLGDKVLNMGDDIRANTADVTNLKAGWTLKDAKSGAKNVQAKGEVKVSGDKYITPVVNASGLSLTVDEKALNTRIGNQISDYIGDDISQNQTDIKNLQAGFTIKDKNSGSSDVALGGKDKAAITFQAVTQEGDGTGDVLTAAVSDDRTVTYTLNTKKLKQDLGIGDKGVGTMNSWKLKAGDGAAAAVEDGDTVAFDVKEPNKGLTVEQDGNTVKYGIDGSKIDLAGNTSITNLSNKIENSKIHYFSVKSKENATGSNWNNDGATGDRAIAIGVKTVASGNAAFATGWGAKATGYSDVAIGTQAEATGGWGVAIGQSAKAQAKTSVAMAYDAEAKGANSMAIGVQSEASADNSTAIGHFARALGESSMALGDYAITSTLDGTGKVNQSVALGSHARVAADNSLALGNNSLASIADDVKTEAYLSKEAFKKENGVVSVGNKAYTIGDETIAQNYRRITNVAGGADDNDAVNVAQLKAVQKIAAAKTTIEAGDNVTVEAGSADGSYKISVADTKLKGATNALSLTGNTLKLSVEDTAGNKVTGSVDLKTIQDAVDTDTTYTMTGKENDDNTTTISLTDNDGNEQKVTVATKDTNTYTTGGTYDAANKKITFTRNDDQTYDVDLADFVGNVTDTRNTIVDSDTVTVEAKAQEDGSNEYTLNVKTDGVIAKDNKGIVTGGTVYNETRIENDGKYIKAENTAGQNLIALDKQVDANTTNITKLEYNIYDMGGRIGELGNRVDRVGAGAAALAALHPLDFDPDDKWDFAAGYGHYSGANAVAIGAYYRPNEDTMFSVGGSFGGGENMVNAGVSVKLGQGNNVSTSKVAMAKDMLDMQRRMAEMEAQMAKMQGFIGALTGMDAQAAMFPDVPENHWAYEYVKGLCEQGIIEGYPDGTFAGDRGMTRYELAAMLYRALAKGVSLDARAVQEFAPELARIRVDVVTKDNDGQPVIERVRVNEEKKAK
ncbi:MAG: YadA-like family protein [Negativicoccus succinicivorans]|uniref:ESPR-type extended signal peptide-containing protein n=1 Tax=Negativicoccus succinicivorans TaxID=620903 RepID=UPI0026EE6C3D|nr:ESPR-type extended signal peptide-containing protein [Negativicoccus succinicivorans]MBS6028872.1 YadA-like family protein [Negativicoccus succinicivorans]